MNVSRGNYYLYSKYEKYLTILFEFCHDRKIKTTNNHRSGESHKLQGAKVVYLEH